MHPRGATAVSFVTLMLAWCTPSFGASCDSLVVGLDPADGNGFLSSLGERIVWGQVVDAPELLLLSFAVWRPANVPTDRFYHLWISEVDSLGVPQPHDVVAEGPAISLPPGDGVAPTKYEFRFDPPLVLPHLGRYYFVIKELHCDPGVYLLTSNQNLYPGGGVWRMTPNLFCAGLGCCQLPGNPDVDIIFEAHFCNTATLTARPSWGSVKRSHR